MSRRLLTGRDRSMLRGQSVLYHERSSRWDRAGRAHCWSMADGERQYSRLLDELRSDLEWLLLHAVAASDCTCFLVRGFLGRDDDATAT